jgi:hypothetical protein
MFDTTNTTANATESAAFPRTPEAHQRADEEGDGKGFLGTGTYSPEDNKLRFYPFARLSAEDYQRVKAAGFGWAPKQEIFVAPMWTPARNAMLITLCGEVGDEDKTMAERAEERAERFNDYSAKRGIEANAARQRAEEIGGRFANGQPILIGHHSERRARKDEERIDSAMRAAVSLWDTRDYWVQRASASKGHADFKQRPDVRFRRLKGIEADLRKALACTKESELFGKLWGAEGLTLEKACAIAARDDFRILETGQTWGTSPYDLLTRLVDAWTFEKVAGYAIRHHSNRIAHHQRWISHYENRIAYERAMLAEDGGLVAEKVEIKVGGCVQIRGTWLTVVRINKKNGETVSITTNARFVRVRGIEEVTVYEAPTEE